MREGGNQPPKTTHSTKIPRPSEQLSEPQRVLLAGVHRGGSPYVRLLLTFLRKQKSESPKANTRKQTTTKENKQRQKNTIHKQAKNKQKTKKTTQMYKSLI